MKFKSVCWIWVYPRIGIGIGLDLDIAALLVCMLGCRAAHVEYEYKLVEGPLPAYWRILVFIMRTRIYKDGWKTQLPNVNSS